MLYGAIGLRRIGRLATALCVLSVLSIPVVVWARQANSDAAKVSAAKVAVIGFKREEYIQRRIQENDLMNQRLTWLLASQTLLFAGYGSLLGASIERLIKERVAKIAVRLGICSAALILLGVIASIGASIGLTEHFGDEDFRASLWAWTDLLGWAVPIGLPLLFIGAWVKVPTTGLVPDPSTGQSVTGSGGDK
jgi:hypothetical protein